MPRLVQFNGILKEAAGKPVAGVAFALYKDQEGGAPVWMETQNVALDESGRYSVLLGATRNEGLPQELFTSGEARWLGVHVQGQTAEPPRILLVSVPYALKAADAETVGGMPPSAFVRAATPVSTAVASSAAKAGANAIGSALPSVTGSGTLNTVPLWTGVASPTSTLGDSALFQTGSGTTAKIGINTTTPSATLDVHGVEILRGVLYMTPTGTATATQGFNSNAQQMVASAFDSANLTAVNQNFRWQAEALSNNTASPSGRLSLLYSSGTGAPAETGFNIASTGLVHWAPGQTFPGTGPGTVTTVGLSAPASDFAVSGSPVTSSGSLALGWTVAPTSADTANAIVKRDGTGSFIANNITASGQILVQNGSLLNPILSQASAPNAAAIVGAATASAGTTNGILGTSVSAGPGSAGVQGTDNNVNASNLKVYTAGVSGLTANPFGVGVLGISTVKGSTVGKARLGTAGAGVWADGPGFGLVATSDLNAVVAYNNSTSGATVYSENDTAAGNGLLFYATAPKVLNNGSASTCSISTHADLNCTGGLYSASDATQARAANGLVKAMLYFDPSQPAGSQIVHCYSSQLTEPAASTPPCGITVTHTGLGLNDFDLGFTVDDRFIQVTPAGGNANHLQLGATIEQVSGSVVGVGTFYVVFNNGDLTDAPLYVTIF
jgi:hypothetical protein